MPGKFVNKKDATIAGHADRWSNVNRRSNSHDAGQGDRGSRNQGTGLQGKLNTMPSHGTDTSRMNPEEKLKYFKSLGLMPGTAPSPEPSIKDLPNVLRKMFQGEPTYIKDITTALKAVPPAQYQTAVKAVFHAAHNTESDDVYDKYEAIMNAITGSMNESKLDEAPTQLDSLQHIWSRIFKDHSEYIPALVKMINRLRPEVQRDAIQSLYDITNNGESTKLNAEGILKNILDAIKKFRTV